VARLKKPATVGDLIRSLAVILIPLVVITVLFTNLPTDHPVKEVDWRPVLATAREEAPYPVLAPANLPEGWRPTRVAWVPEGRPGLNGDPSPRNLWELGFLTPDDTYVGLHQGDQQVQDLVAQESRQGAPDGTSVVGGQQWQRLVSADDRTRSLVLTSPGVTTVVSGDLEYAGLEAYASTLTAGG
jgi:hypothetical protein